MIVDAIKDRLQTNAAVHLEVIAAGARKVAAGGTADPAAVAAALAAVGQTEKDFEAAVARARQRAEWLSSVEAMPAAKARLSKAETTLQQEFEKFIAVRDAFAEKAHALEAEVNTAHQILRDGGMARDKLLDPRFVQGALSARWADAVAETREAESANNDAEANLARIERRLSAVAAAVAEMAGQPAEKVDPSTWKAPPGAPEWHADGHHGELQRKHRDYRELVAERDAARATLAEAAKAVSTWRKKRDAMVAEVLKS